MVKHCSICLTETTGAPLCDRCAGILRRDCKLVHLAIAAGARVGSGTIRNLERDEALLAKYDAGRAHHNFTCEEANDEYRARIFSTTHWHLHEECEEVHDGQARPE